MIAVAAVPIKTPASLLFDVFESIAFSFPPPSASSPELIIEHATRKMPVPATSVKTVVIIRAAFIVLCIFGSVPRSVEIAHI